jgi:hypothetical protein
VYGSEAVLPTDLAFGAPCIQQYEEGTTEGTRKVDLDNIEEHRVAALMRHTRHEQLLTRKVHSTPNTQQAEQSWLHTRRERKTCQSIFPENQQKIKQLNIKAWNLPGGTRQFHIYG